YRRGFVVPRRAFAAARLRIASLTPAHGSASAGLASAIRNHFSSFASFTQFTVQLISLCGWLSLFQRLRHGLSFLGSITSFLFAEAACPSANWMSVLRPWRLQGH